MRLEDVTAEVRPRSPWEASDLGLSMVRRHWGRIMISWLLCVLPLWGLLALLFRKNPAWFIFFVWWLKPLCSRIPLLFISHALFGSAPRVRDAVKAFPGMLVRGFFTWLVWLRFSPARVQLQSVAELEGLKGRRLRQRRSLLATQSDGAGSVTWAWLLLQVALGVAALPSLIFMLLPEVISDPLLETLKATIGERALPQPLMWGLAACWALSIAVTEPFFVGASFGIYVNARTHLEGWDVELALRRMGTRLSSLGPRFAVLAVIAAFGAMITAVPAARAAESAEDAAREVIKHPDFEVLETEEIIPSTPKPPKASPPSSSPSSPSSAGSDLFSGMSDGFSFLFQVAMWSALAALLAWLGWLLYKAWEKSKKAAAPVTKTDAPVARPAVVMGMDVRPDSLPRDVPSAAMDAWRAGKPHQAMQLLYRAALAWLIVKGSLPVSESDTEADCVRRALDLPDSDSAGFFRELSDAWVATAYAGSPPDESRFSALCRRWPFHGISGDLPRAAGGGRILLSGAAAALAAIIALPLAGCSSGPPPATRKVPVRYKGAARWDPWLAARRTLLRCGCEVSELKHLTTLPGDDGTTMIMPADAIASKEEARRVKDWTAGGGHLVILVTGADPHTNDFSAREGWETVRVLDRDSLPLLGALDISISSTPHGFTGNVQMDGYEYRASFHPGVTLDPGNSIRPDFIAGTPSSAAMVSWYMGRGRCTIIANGRPFRNRWLADPDHAALLVDLVRLDGRNSVVFVRGGRFSLLALVAENAWMPVVGLGLLLLCWLWRHLPRFGPVRSLPDSRPARFTEHLDQSGTFLWRHGHAQSLLQPARDAVLSAAVRRWPGISRDTAVRALAWQTGMSEAEILEALDSDPGTDPARMTVLSATLQRLQTAFARGS